VIRAANRERPFIEALDRVDADRVRKDYSTSVRRAAERRFGTRVWGSDGSGTCIEALPCRA
jgi:hypothetical protein